MHGLAHALLCDTHTLLFCLSTHWLGFILSWPLASVVGSRGHRVGARHTEQEARAFRAARAVITGRACNTASVPTFPSPLPTHASPPPLPPQRGSQWWGTFDFDSPPFDWGSEYERPATHLKDLIIYEMSVRCAAPKARQQLT